ncbi:MAG: hypothetical protein KBD14_00585 [Candidatus Pacebacteria bacterium]|nr:hypothetical protein [Candidatus Paceibacterota bacterium]
MGKKVLAEDSAKLAGLQIDLLQKMRNGNLSMDHLEYFLNLNFSQREELLGRKPEKEVYLKLLSGAETLFLDECDGQSTIADSKKNFYSIDSDFKNYRANEKGIATPKTLVEVHEFVKNGKFAQIFGSLNSDLDKLCLTQDQILNFIKNHKNWLRKDGYGTFFLFKSGEKFFVAFVRVDSLGLSVCVDRFDRDSVWDAERQSRFVTPQLEKLES